MFDKSAGLYDAFYHAQGKDYATESAKVIEQIVNRVPQARTLLDVGCGSGGHLEYLRERFTCSGVDIAADLLDVARSRYGDAIPFHQGDMANFDLGQQFDAVVCLFSAIGYVGTYDRLASAARCFARHVRSGGVVVVEPWITPDAWNDNSKAHIIVVDDESNQAVRMGKSRREGLITKLDMHYLVATGHSVEHRVEQHELCLFTFDEYAQAFGDAGFAVEIDSEGLIGRGLIVAQLP